MEQERVYSVREDMLKRSCISGFNIKDNQIIAVSEHESYIFLPVMDRGHGEKHWGRLGMDIELKDKAVCQIYAMASDNIALNKYLMDSSISAAQKLQAFNNENSIKSINKNDILLYDLCGRYLWLCIIVNEGCGSTVGNIRVYARGDFLMDTFPEIYRQRNGTLHRYLSIFSSIYKDMDEEMLMLPSLLEPEAAPPEMLPILAGWMGLDVSGGFLSEETLRTLVKEAYDLVKKRGTREALERLTELMTGEKAIIIEKNLMPAAETESQKSVENCLYGNDIYGVTLLIKSSTGRYKKSHLLHLLNQLKPARCDLKIIYLDVGGVLDGYTYMDINACISSEEKLSPMDFGARIGQVLQA